MRCLRYVWKDWDIPCFLDNAIVLRFQCSTAAAIQQHGYGRAVQHELAESHVPVEYVIDPTTLT